MGNGKGPADHISQLVNILDNKIIFGNGHSHTQNIDLLETVLSQQVHPYIAGNGHNRDGIHISSGNPRHQIGGAGTRGGQTDPYLSGCPCISVCCMGCSLFMRGEHMGDLPLMFVECIVNVQNRTARIAKDGLDALFLQTLNQNLRTIQHNRLRA